MIQGRGCGPNSADAFTVLLAFSALVGCADSTIESRNDPPNVVILDPVDGTVFSVYDTIDARASVADRMTGSDGLRVSWASSLDGALHDGGVVDGTSAFSWSNPTAGEHRLSITALDGLGLASTSSVTLTVTEDLPPDCAISAPTEAVVWTQPGPFVVQAQVADDHTADVDLSVRWESDVDGALGEAVVDDGGLVVGAVDPSPGAHTLRLVVTDSVGQSCEDTSAALVQRPPELPPVSLQPSPARIDEDLRAVLAGPATDPDGPDPTLIFRWWLDGVEQPFLTGDTVPMAALSRDQLWRVEAVAEDEHGARSVWQDAETVVANSAPSAPTVAIEPTEPTQVEDLLCVVLVDGVDPDPADVVTHRFEWWVDGLPTGELGATLPAAATEPNESWTCQAFATDGDMEGPAGVASVVVEESCTSLLFDGTDGRLTSSTLPSWGLSSGDFTVEAWVRPESHGTDTLTTMLTLRGAGAADGWFFGVAGAGAGYGPGQGVLWWQPRNAGANVVGSTPLELDQWHHVALTFDVTTSVATLWLDGLVDGQGIVPAPLGGLGAPLEIGDGSYAAGAFDGWIDDVRVSSTQRYGGAFVPSSPLPADADTLLAFAFEEAAGTTTNDAGPSAATGTLSGGVAFSAESSCAVNLAPTTPTITLGPTHPEVDDDLICSLIGPSVDPEGQALSYSGEFWVDGAPTLYSFSTFPATLPAAATDEGQQWTCRVWASDGVRDSGVATDARWVGAMPICALTGPADVDAGTVCSITAPIDGRIRLTMLNPDASKDGHFLVDLGTWGRTWLSTGPRTWAYAGTTALGWGSFDVELNAAPSMGPMVIDVSYEASSGSDGTGDDSLIVEFVYGGTLSLAGATEILTHSAAPMQAAPTQVVATVQPGERLIVQALSCGFGGGAHGFYGDDNSTPNDDGFFRMDTGWPESCALPLRSLSFPAGVATFTVANEDDYFGDNTGTRSARLWRQ